MSDVVRDERLMALLLAWWWQEPVSDATGPTAAVEDVQSMLRHLEENGYCITTCSPKEDR